MGPQVLLPPGAGLVLEQVRLCDEIVHLRVRCGAAGARCPACGAWSEAVHSRYERHLGDLPIAGRRVVVDWRVRRFRCPQPACARRTFVEQAPVWAERYAHRTLRLRSVLEAIGLALGGRPGSRQCIRLAIPTSRTTLVRLVRALPERPIEAPRVLGVDEFALRRGHRYGTILVDADAHRVIDLLEDPSGDALVAWLGDHAGVEVICRDRDGAYASAAGRGAPSARQVADRWHLTRNLAEAVERFAGRALAVRRTQGETEDAPPAAAPFTPPPPLGRLAARTERRHAEVHALLAQGLSVNAAARRLGLDWRTVRKFAGAATAAPLVHACRYRTKLDPFLPYLARRWGEGQHVAAALFGEIGKLGYRGSERAVREHLSRWRTAAPPRPAQAGLPGPRALAWLLLRRPSELDDEEQKLLQDLSQSSPELVGARQLAQRFLGLVRERRGRELDEWLADANTTGPPELRGFSRNLQRDWQAVSAGLTEPWSSGSVEGHVNKLKVVKRQMFGRARFDLLRKRVLLAN
ncbi:MAG TPA: ISL3 family transposase [Chloroflexota bacterium]|nr:ISL3 family transposase [Chloroflexota bacterium]